jgi:uncharacterized protein (TIGR02757 family)
MCFAPSADASYYTSLLVTFASMATLSNERLACMLNQAVERFEHVDFIEHDPISVPHRFTTKQDREIMAFFAATLAWGQRATIIKNVESLAELMDQAPYQFITQHQEPERARFLDFKHRTFQATDTLYFLDFLQRWYRQDATLETAFSRHLTPGAVDVTEALVGFHSDFFNHPCAPERTRKHVATPTRGSTCKRLNMFLRWMVRPATKGVDFGIWTEIKPHQLLIPLDVHVDRVARKLGLLERTQTDWQAVLDLTQALRAFDSSDPVRFDFALFGMGVLEGKT